jgi:ABC-type transporter lipoprotein component MlaA
VFFPEDKMLDVPGTLPGIKDWVVEQETPSNAHAREDTDALFDDAKFKYEKGIDEWIWRPLVSAWELFDMELVHHHTVTGAQQIGSIGTEQ